MLRGYTLRNKLLLLVLIPLLALGLMLIYFAGASLRKTLTSELLEKGDVLAEHGAAMAADHLENKNPGALNIMLRRYTGIDRDIEYAYVSGMDGEVLAHSLGEEFPEGLRRTIDAWRDLASKRSPLSFRGHDVYDITAPIGGGNLGMLHLGLSTAHIRVKTKAAVARLTWTGAALLCAGTLAAFLFSLMLTDPLTEVAAVTRRIGGGDFEERVRVRSKDELGDLARAVNDMAGNLQKTTVSNAAYKEQKRFLESVIQSVTYPFMVIDAGTREIVMANDAVGEGWRGRTCHSHTRGKEEPCDGAQDCVVEMVRERGEPMVFEEHRTGDGRSRDFEVHGHPVFDEHGRVVQVIKQVIDVTDRKKAERERERMINDLEAALSEVKTLEGLLPVCASCKKIRDDDGYWQQMENYVAEHSDAEFSHGICPECSENLYGKV